MFSLSGYTVLFQVVSFKILLTDVCVSSTAMRITNMFYSHFLSIDTNESVMLFSFLNINN